jgi:7-cyano-7-deazaguanine synthase
MQNAPNKAVVLLSGGVDSSTSLAIATSEGFSCHALSFHYGQRNDLELEAASRVARALGAAQHRIVALDVGWMGGSALTADLQVPKSLEGLGAAPSGIPVTYVPARNSIFLSVGAAWADVLETDHLFIGVNQVDYSGYPDCRPAFIEAMQRALRMGTRRCELRIHAPLMDLSKGEIIRRGTALGLDYGLTWSCYDPQGGLACGGCDSCVHRRRGFHSAGVPDPTRYASSPWGPRPNR